MTTSHTTAAMNTTRSALNLGEPDLCWEQAIDSCDIDHAERNRGQMENRSTRCPFSPIWDANITDIGHNMGLTKKKKKKTAISDMQRQNNIQESFKFDN